MIKTVKDGAKQARRAVLRHPVKLTALFYLKEALVREQYEICRDMIRIAKEFGAADFEIQDLLEDPRRRPG